MNEQKSPCLRKKNHLPKYDYSQNGAYFVTICTQGKKCFFGKIEKGKMVLNEKGEIVFKNWQEIPRHFPLVSLGEFVVMPNHVHGILIFETAFLMGEDGHSHVDSQQRKRQAQKLFRIVGAFKAAVSKEIHLADINFGWQKSFYDHVVRNEIALNRISEYIRWNPAQWESEKDRNHILNIEL